MKKTLVFALAVGSLVMAGYVVANTNPDSSLISKNAPKQSGERVPGTTKSADKTNETRVAMVPKDLGSAKLKRQQAYPTTRFLMKTWTNSLRLRTS